MNEQVIEKMKTMKFNGMLRAFVQVLKPEQSAQ